MQWGVRTYCQWRSNRLNDYINYDVKIYEADLENVGLLSKGAFKYAMCMFIPEVVKVKDGSDYPGKTLYEMVMSIQKYLHQNIKFWKILDDEEFSEVCNVLDNTMKERAEMNLGQVKKQVAFIPQNLENDLWEKVILGEDRPDKLHDTVHFLLGINLGLRAGDEHHALRRNSKDKPSQLNFERASNGQCCLVYHEDTITKTNDGGLGSLKKGQENSMGISECQF